MFLCCAGALEHHNVRVSYDAGEVPHVLLAEHPANYSACTCLMQQCCSCQQCFVSTCIVPPPYTAGRFVCNYTLYESLRQCQHQQQEQLRRQPSERGRWQAVFVHVPSFSVVPAERQLAFATDLLQLLALQPATEPRQDEAGSGSHGSLQQLLCWVQQQKVPAMFAFLTTWFTLKTK